MTFLSTTLRLTRGSWIYTIICRRGHQKEMIRKGFKAALVREAFDQVEAHTQVAENPFLDIELDIVDEDV